MNKFVCTICGKPCYFAAKLRDLRENTCPYCGGKVQDDMTESSKMDDELEGSTLDPPKDIVNSDLILFIYGV